VSRADEYRRRAQRCLEMAGTFRDREARIEGPAAIRDLRAAGSLFEVVGVGAGRSRGGQQANARETDYGFDGGGGGNSGGRAAHAARPRRRGD